MDSLTQITLGAAMGEMVAGRKIGNRAMLWGAIAGTIPDLDVFIGSIFMDDLNALAFHRGFTHSITFAILFPAVLAFFTKWFYDSGYYRKRYHILISSIIAIIFIFLFAFILNLFPVVASGGPSWLMIGLSILLTSFFSWRLWKNYTTKETLGDVKMSWTRWYILFFIATITHPLLDCCTTYGTQLFQPFSDIRISWDNISVFDPAYTFPFLIFLLAAAFTGKRIKIRSYLNYLGIVVSSAYMIWTFSNKAKVNQVFKESLVKENIAYTRIITTPTIANNLLWNCVAEAQDSFYMGNYSILDKEPLVKDIASIPKNLSLIQNAPNSRVIERLKWFSNDYLCFRDEGDGKIKAIDLRYGKFLGSASDEGFIFQFSLEPTKDDFLFQESRGGPPENPEGWLKEYFKRIKGI